jgi:hypothetical protein
MPQEKIIIIATTNTQLDKIELEKDWLIYKNYKLLIGKFIAIFDTEVYIKLRL